MKKLLLYLSVALIFITTPLSVVALDNEAVENANTNVTAQEVDPNTIRNQNFLVPTKEGVQKANQYEADKIKKLEEVPLEGLTKSYLLGDYKSGEILEGYNLDEVRAMASISKLVSIFVVLDKVEER